MRPAAYSAEDAFFVRGNVGQSSINGEPFDSDTGYAIDGGYRWAVGGSAAIGVEAGYADLGNFAAKLAVSGVNFDVHGPTIGADARFNIAPDWHFDARTGYMRADFNAHANFGLSQKETLDAWYAGLGFGYDFSNHLSVNIAYDYYRASEHGFSRSPSLFSVGAEYRF